MELINHPVAETFTVKKDVTKFRAGRKWCFDNVTDAWSYVIHFEEEGRTVSWYFENALDAVHFKLKFC